MNFGANVFNWIIFCIDVFFCDLSARQYPCHIKADCRDVPGAFQCTCIAGYSGNGLSCESKYDNKWLRSEC